MSIHQSDPDVVPLQFYVHRDFKAAFSRSCRQQHTTMSDVLRRAMIDFLREHPVLTQKELEARYSLK